MNDNTMTSEIDLVPSDYRAHQVKLRIVRRFAYIVIPLLLIGGLLYTILRFQTWQIEHELEALEKRALVTSQQRDQIAQLRKTAEDIQRQLVMLNRLRSGGQALGIFRTIDRALPPRAVWFRMWTFQRAGFVVEGNASEVNRGYFVVIPADNEASSSEAWRLETHMDIKGQARDHSALSEFVRNLFGQPQVQDVQIVNTARRGYKDTSVIDFDLRIVLHSGAGDN